MPTLSHPLTTLVLETLGVLAGVGVVAVLFQRSPSTRTDLRAAAAAVLAALTVVFALGNVPAAISALTRARGSGVNARAGLEYCFDETGSQSMLPFINWVKRRLPAHAVYALNDTATEPDAWCITLALLPLLPSGPGGRAQWVIDIGSIAPDLKARLARHDPAVEAFGTGYALARVGAS